MQPFLASPYSLLHSQPSYDYWIIINKSVDGHENFFPIPPLRKQFIDEIRMKIAVHYPLTDKCSELQAVLRFNGFARWKMHFFRYLIKGLRLSHRTSDFNGINGSISYSSRDESSSISAEISELIDAAVAVAVGRDWGGINIIVRFDLLWLQFRNLKHSIRLSINKRLSREEWFSITGIASKRC